ncbi:caspase family protein [Labilibacter marinus]|uniref:caspase family protein n=1 Tax=Labilibacter marinus TaxID=1477105 RepID=UPI00094FD92D|nr:caspase family protein [Labilibacter marinus]
MRYLIFLLIFSISFPSISFGAVILKSKSIAVPDSIIPSFLEFHKSHEIRAFFYKEISNVGFEWTKKAMEEISFYRVITLKSDSSQHVNKFLDYHPNGNFIRLGEVLKCSVTNDGSTVGYDLQIQEYYPTVKDGSPVLRCSYPTYLESIYYEFSGKNELILPHIITAQLKFKEWYKEGGYLSDTLSAGNYEYYHPNGKASLTFWIKEGFPNDTVKRYSSNGELIDYAVYKNGKQTVGFKPSMPIVSGNKKALIIAIGDYSEESRWPKIEVNNDVDLIQKSLRYNGFGEISLIKDSFCTKKDIVLALKKLASETKKGDVVFIHYSGHGQQILDDNNDELDGYDEAIVPYDAHRIFKAGVYEGQNHIRDDELILLLNQIREKAGRSGQVVFSLDANNFGPEQDEVNSNKTRSILTRGGFFEIDSQINNLKFAPFIMLTACQAKEINTAYLDGNGNDYGSFSYALGNILQLINSDVLFHELFDLLKHHMDLIAPYQTPGIAGSIEEHVLMPKEIEKQLFIEKGDLYVLSIGIDNYYDIDNSVFDNCDTDAQLFSSFMKEQFKDAAGSDSKVFSFTLLNEQARKDSITHYLNYIIDNSKPEDYFVFNFAGYSDRDSNFTTGVNVTNFYTYRDSLLSKDLNDSEKISLHQLRDLLEFIPANNQLFLTESGNTKDFQKNFIKALIENNPDISKLRKRNRVIICPKEVGFDNVSCDGNIIPHGPLIYFLSSIPSYLNVFYFFDKEENAELVIHQVLKKQIQCKVLDRSYSDFFFEKKYFEEMEHLFPSGSLKSRGAGVLSPVKDETIKGMGKKHALVIGINNYSNGNPMWSNLNNPTYDAEKIGHELETGYGFKVDLLLDANNKDIFSSLKTYSETLDENDQLFIFIAGHGDFDNEFFHDGFIVTSSSRPTNDDQYRNTYISFSEIETIINNLPPKQILLCLDVCFGGGFDVKVKQNRNKQDIYEEQELDDFVSDKIDLKTRLYITSGSLNEVPDGYAGRHSPFAYKILEALRTSGGSRGYLTSNQVFNFVERLPSKPMFGSFGSNEPGSAFLFISEDENKD